MKQISVFAESDWPFLIRAEVEINGILTFLHFDRAEATYLANSLLTAIERSETLERVSRDLGEDLHS